ncbi:MAG: flavin reductase, partial [Rikenellaceae bacterium]|nr:flavin reductase [Rikenellaceae bacterium]
FNTMTASWGAMGFLWNKPVAFVFVRPERYTFEFMEEYSAFTLSFMGKDQRHALKVCGSQSGRDSDKIADAGLKP